MKKEELKPCPFCGCALIGLGVEATAFEDRKIVAISCGDCSASMSKAAYYDESRYGVNAIAEELREDWNTRHLLLPAPNRKSCKPEEHYMSRFKEGFNRCLQVVKDMNRRAVRRLE